MRRSVCRALTGLALVASVAACGDDDGAGVRNISGSGAGSGSASASASAPASGSASAPASGSASASAPASGSASAPASGSASASGVAACVPVGGDAAATTEVAVALDEWSIEPEGDAAPAGSVTFVAENVGEEPHELVVVRGDDPADLPVEDGQVQEDQLEDGAFVGEIEAFPAGETCEGTFDLEAGDYVLFCNLVETEADGSLESHVEEGMVTTFTVTG